MYTKNQFFNFKIIFEHWTSVECLLLDSLLETLLNLWMWQWIWQWIQQTTDSYIILSKLLALKCQKQKHSKNIVLLWPCGHKDQSFLAFWYKSKQDIFKEVKIQMKKDNFVLNLYRFLSDSLSHSLSNSIWHCWKRFQQQIWIL